MRFKDLLRKEQCSDEEFAPRTWLVRVVAQLVDDESLPEQRMLVHAIVDPDRLRRLVRRGPDPVCLALGRVVHRPLVGNGAA